MDGKLNIEKEEVYSRMGISMPYKVMSYIYSGELLYKRMMLDILFFKGWKPVEKRSLVYYDRHYEGDIDMGKVYKIVSGNRMYIGSTCFMIEDRLRKHLLDYEFYNRYFNGYCSSYEILKSGCYDIVLLEDNISKEELLERESWHIMCNRDMCVNILDPVTKMKLYDNGEEKRERDKLRDKYMIREVCRVIKESSI